MTEMEAEFKLVQILPKDWQDMPKMNFDIALNPNENETKYTIGRHSQCNIRLDSKVLPCFISRQHASLTLTDEGHLILQDNGSRNGTFVNDILIKINMPVFLNDGDTVTFGCVAPDRTISPGCRMIQDNSPFRFLVNGRSCDSPIPFEDEKNDSNCSNSFQTIECTKSIKNKLLSPKYDSCNDSGVSFSPRRTSARFASPKTPKQSSQRSLNSTASLGEISNVPMTETNLLAYCKRTYNIHCKSQGKENLNNNEKPKVETKRRRSSTSSTKSRKKSKKNDTCWAYNCTKPADSNGRSPVTWVQCDSCDKWYHTACVGCNYKTVKKANQEFICGLC